MPRSFTDTERAVLRIAQRDLPDTLTPYADMAREAGTDEEAVLALLAGMKEDGSIRRFGANLKHQKTGFTHNAMVAWKMDEAHVDAAGTAAAENARVSHCYYRPSDAADWPYVLYTMIHGRSEAECAAVIRDLAAIPHMGEHAVLTSLRELKKTSMTYF